MATETITSSRTYVANQAGQWISLLALSGGNAIAVYTPPTGPTQTFRVLPPGPVNIGSLVDGGSVVVTVIAGGVVVDTNIDDATFFDANGTSLVRPDGSAVYLASRNPFIRFCIPGRETSGTQFLDVSGNAAHATIEASNTTPFAVDGRMSTVVHASAGGIAVPLASLACDLRTDSAIMSVSMTRANPATLEFLVSFGAGGAGSQNPGFFFNHRSSPAGAGRVTVNRGDVSGTNLNGTATTALFSNAGGTQEVNIVMAFDAPTGSVYLYRDGALAASDVGLAAGANAIFKANTQGARLGGVLNASTSAAAFRGWQCYTFPGRGLPLNISALASMLAEAPSIPLPASSIAY